MRWAIPATKGRADKRDYGHNTGMPREEGDKKEKEDVKKKRI